MEQTTEIIEWTGYVAAVCTTVAFLPQAFQVWRTGSTDDLSLGMLLLFDTGLTFWLFYGLLLESGPIIVANSLTLVLAGYILVMKLRHLQPRTRAHRKGDE